MGYSHMRCQRISEDQVINENASIPRYLKIDILKVIDRETSQGRRAWKELTEHHCIPFFKDGMFILDRFWCNETGADFQEPIPFGSNVVSMFFDNDENADEYASLHGLVMRYVDSLGVSDDAYDDILLELNW